MFPLHLTLEFFYTPQSPPHTQNSCSLDVLCYCSVPLPLLFAPSPSSVCLHVPRSQLCCLSRSDQEWEHLFSVLRHLCVPMQQIIKLSFCVCPTTRLEGATFSTPTHLTRPKAESWGKCPVWLAPRVPMEGWGRTHCPWVPRERVGNRTSF